MTASAQQEQDFEAIGRLEDARHAPSTLTAGPHSFEPSVVYKLFGISTPHVFGAAAMGWTDNLLLGDPEAPGERLRRETFARWVGGLRLDTELGEHRHELLYQATLTEYLDTGRFDTLEQLVGSRLDLYFTDVEGHLDLSWSRRSYPQSIQLRGIVDIETFNGRGWVEARLGRYGVRVGASGRRLDYLEPELRFLDNDRYGVDLQVYGRIRPKLRALVEYNGSVLTYDEGRRGALNDYQLHQLRAGLDGVFTPKLSASLKLGATYQDVERGPNPESREFVGFTASTSARFELLPRTHVTLAYVRELLPSTTSNFLESDDVELRVEQLLFEERVTARASGGYTRARISSGGHLNRLRAGASITYKIRQWLSLVGGYEFDKLGSPGRNSDFVVHRVTLSLGVGL